MGSFCLWLGGLESSGHPTGRPVEPIPSDDGANLIFFTAFPHKARGLGIEPRFTASKAAVLPLDDPRALCGINSGRCLPRTLRVANGAGSYR